MMMQILFLIVGVQLGLALTLWRLGETRRWLADEREYLQGWRDELFKQQERLERERRGGCGR